MASGFDSGKSTCEGAGCRGTTDVKYYVEEKKKLCEECATRTRNARKERKGGINLFCEKHDQPLTVYCKTHEVSVCHQCAVINHQRPCKLEDVNDAIAEKKQQQQQLLDIQASATDKTTMWKQYGDRICLCEDDAKKHLKSVRDEVDSVIDDEIKKAKDRTQREAALINNEADDEIRRMQRKERKTSKAMSRGCRESTQSNRIQTTRTPQ